MAGRRRTTVQAAGLAVVLALGLVGCADPVGTTPRSASPGPGTPSPAPASSAPASPSTTSAATAAPASCQRELPAATWAAIRAGWERAGPRLPRSSFTTSATARGGTDVVADVRSAHAAAVTLVEASGRTTVIRADDGGEHGQAGGGFDGRYAVWKDYRTPESLDEFTVWLWDRATGRLSSLGGNHGEGTTAYPSPWTDPVVASGHATWVEGVTADGVADVRVADLATGAVWTAGRGQVTGSAIVAGLVVWSEGPAPGVLNVPRAADLTSRRSVPPPAALAGEDGLFLLSSDGDALAWAVPQQGPGLGSAVPPSSTTLVRYASSTGSVARTVLTLTEGGLNPPLLVAGTTVLGTSSEGSFVAEAASGATSTLTGVFSLDLHAGLVRYHEEPGRRPGLRQELAAAPVRRPASRAAAPARLLTGAQPGSRRPSRSRTPADLSTTAASTSGRRA